ncbi:DUF490 domain-containing protein [Formosimonas limnophila]|uniref:DUF490 domain-containing protein n=1 Tax=Formosimonas limnophila TaxID=1384487 RepID=A0A8J3FZM8_9BURK|nr:translocation/assembly module TamB domain-containing protein [Formosimonas limnophila]GHA64461.1 DUF490 domain-containing protein [Formosimonas limnophila]
MTVIRGWGKRLKQRWQALRVSTVVTEEETQIKDSINEEKPTPIKKKSRWLRRLLLTLCILPIILIGTVLILAQSEQGTRVLFRLTHVLSAGSIDAQWRSGSLAHGGAVERLLVDLPNTKINISNLSGEWSWNYVPLNWHVSNISADEVSLTTIPTTQDKPVESVLMPFAFEVDRIQINALHITSGTSTTTMTAIDGAVKTDKRQHQINLANLTQGSASFNGQASIDGERPFRMVVDVRAISQYESNDYKLSLSARGDLQRLTLKLDAEGGAADLPMSGAGDLSIQLLERYYIHQGQLELKHFNPYAFWNKLLKADLDVTLDAIPQNTESNDADETQPVAGQWRIVNHAPAPLSNLSLPVTQSSGSFKLSETKQTLNDMVFDLPNGGQIMGTGIWQSKEGAFEFAINGFDLKTVHPKLIATKLNGPLSLTVAGTEQSITTTLAQSNLQLFADVNVNNERVKVNQARINSHLADTPDAKIEVQGELAYTEGLPFVFKAQLLQFNLATLGDFPSSKLQGEFNIKGISVPEVKLDVKGALNSSTWAGVPATGKVDVSFAAPDTLTARELNVSIGVNRFFAKGGLGVSSDVGQRLAIDVNAPNLAQLQFGLAGGFTAKGDLTGSLTRPRGKLNAIANQLVIGEQRINQAMLDATWEHGDSGAMNGKLKITGYRNGPKIDFSDVDLSVSGTQAVHQFSGIMKGRVEIFEPQTAKPAVAWMLDGDFSGSGKVTDAGWQGQIKQLVNQGQPDITLQRPMSLAYESGEIKMSNIAANVADAQLTLDTLNIKGLRINSRGRISNLVVPQWLTWLKLELPFYTTDLVVQGQWDMTMGDAPSGGFIFERERGDISFDRRQRNPIDLQAMMLNGKLSRRSLTVDGRLESQKFGKVNVDGQIGLVGSSDGLVLSGLSPLNLKAVAQLSELKQFNSLLGVNMRINGQMQGDLAIKGVVGNPIVSGLLSGQNLDLLHVEEGIRLKDGVIRLKLTESLVDFEQFDFSGVEGKFSVRGQVSYGASGNKLSARVTMDKLRPFVRVDRLLTISGNAELGYDGANQLTITGRLRADKALIDLPPTLPPSLSDDVLVCRTIKSVDTMAIDENVTKVVIAKPMMAAESETKTTVFDTDIVVVRTKKTEPQASKDLNKTVMNYTQTSPKPVKQSDKVCSKGIGKPIVSDDDKLNIIPQIDVTLDLGNDFRFKGQGADVKLVGEVRLKTEDRDEKDTQSALRATGLVRVEEGFYRFYGQRLTVERGQISFQGPIEDPGLNMRAIRTVGSNEVGVELTGTLTNPQARLVSTPEMPDEEKLSWLLFGRSSSTLNTSDGSAIAGAAAILLGSDQGRKITEKLGIDSFNFGSSDSGLDGTVVGIGKRLTDRFSVAYEQSLEDVAGVVKVTWTLSRHWEIVLRGGSIDGVDIQYSKRFDRVFGNDPGKK